MPLTVADIMERMPGAIIPEKAAGIDSVIHFKFTGAEPGEWHSDVAPPMRRRVWEAVAAAGPRRSGRSGRTGRRGMRTRCARDRVDTGRCRQDACICC